MSATVAVTLRTYRARVHHDDIMIQPLHLKKDKITTRLPVPLCLHFHRNSLDGEMRKMIYFAFVAHSLILKSAYLFSSRSILRLYKSRSTRGIPRSFVLAPLARVMRSDVAVNYDSE